VIAVAAVGATLTVVALIRVHRAARRFCDRLTIFDWGH